MVHILPQAPEPPGFRASHQLSLLYSLARTPCTFNPSQTLCVLCACTAVHSSKHFMEAHRTSAPLLGPACCLTSSEGEKLCRIRPGASLGLLFAEESCLVSFERLPSAQGLVYPLSPPPTPRERRQGLLRNVTLHLRYLKSGTIIAKYTPASIAHQPVSI